jgi:hypothetical protein
MIGIAIAATKSSAPTIFAHNGMLACIG